MPTAAHSPIIRTRAEVTNSYGHTFAVEERADGTWRAYHDGTLYSVAGDREHLEEMIRTKIDPDTPPAARTTDPGTSHAAAASATTGRAKCRAQVLECFRDAYDGLTLAELVHRHNARADVGRFAPFSDSGIRTRAAELADDKVLVDTGVRRRMASGRYGIVWGLSTAAASELLRAQ